MDKRVFLCLSVFFFLSGMPARAQKPGVKDNLKGSQSVYIEILGNSWYSVNYDRVFYHQQKNALSWRAGVNYLYFKSVDVSSYTILGEINYMRGKVPHFFEAGLGLNYWDGIRVGNLVEIHWNFVPRIGYRYQRSQGLFFRAGYTPWIFPERIEESIFLLRAGISVGYTFQ